MIEKKLLELFNGVQPFTIEDIANGEEFDVLIKVSTKAGIHFKRAPFDVFKLLFTNTVNQDWVDPNINYIGHALLGTSNDSNTWTITKITVNENGTVTVETATGSWTDRYTLIYT